MKKLYSVLYYNPGSERKYFRSLSKALRFARAFAFSTTRVFVEDPQYTHGHRVATFSGGKPE